MLHKFRFIFLGLILILGLYLRYDNLYIWPREGATFDEFAWTFQGLSLITSGIPTSWSPHKAYTNRVEYYNPQGAHFTLVTSYLEHPPLFGLVAGGFAYTNGIRTFDEVTIAKIRPLALIMGVVSIYAVFLLASAVYGEVIGLIASGLYAIIPTVVIGSRIVQNENFFIPFFLLSLFLISKFIQTKNPWFRNIAAVICGLLTLAKVPWIAAALGIVLIFFYLKKYKDAFTFLAIVIPIFSLFFIYGFYFDSKLFFQLWQLQLQRYDMAFNSIFALFTSPYLVDRFMIDGWIYFGWFSVFLLSTKDFKKNYMVLLPFLAYFAIFIFAIPNESSHGWYRYPIYPFLIISTALFLKEYFNKNYLLTFFFFIFTGLSMLQLSWAQSLGFSFLFLRFFLVLFSISLMPLFFPKTKKISDYVNIVSLVVIFILNIWSVRNYNEQ